MFYQCKNASKLASACGSRIASSQRANGTNMKTKGGKMFGKPFRGNPDLDETVQSLKRLYYKSTAGSRVPQPKWSGEYWEANRLAKDSIPES